MSEMKRKLTTGDPVIEKTEARILALLEAWLVLGDEHYRDKAQGAGIIWAMLAEVDEVDAVHFVNDLAARLQLLPTDDFVAFGIANGEDIARCQELLESVSPDERQDQNS